MIHPLKQTTGFYCSFCRQIRKQHKAKTTVAPGSKTAATLGWEEKLLIPSIRISAATSGSVRKALSMVPSALPNAATIPKRRARKDGAACR